MPDYASLITPVNNSGVLGLARVGLEGNVLTLDLAASGLTPGGDHPLHIHGFLDDRPSALANYKYDTNGNGLVETPEGETAFGPVLAGLTTVGDAGYFLEYWQNVFPVADAAGNLSFSASYTLDSSNPSEAAILERLTARLEERVFEVHGLQFLPGPDGDPGGYDPTMPVSEGLLLPAPGDLATVDSATFLARATQALSLLAPYSLNPEGTGPVAPEAAGAGAGATTFAALLAPSNNSGVFGLSLAQLDAAAGTLTVTLLATGLTPDQTHAAHIHGFADDRPSLLPNLTLDADRDGFVEDAEGAPVVGPTLLALSEDGSVSNAKLGVNFPEADASGTIRLQQTYRFDASDPAQAQIFAELQQRLVGREVQLHGLDLPANQGEGTTGEVDGTANYKEELPVANGIYLPVTGGAEQTLVTNAQAVFAALTAPDAPLV